MNKKSLVSTILVISLLFLGGMGGYALGWFAPSDAGYSTSYQDFPDPQPAPKTEPEKTVEVPGLIQAFDIRADGETIAIVTSTDLILYNLQTLKELQRLPLSEQGFQVRFSPDGKKLALSARVSNNRESGILRVTVWDVTTWKTIYEYEVESQGVYLEGGLAWASDSERIAFSVPERGLSLADVKSGRLVETLDDFLVPPFDLSWSPNGSRLIATGDLGYGLRRWRVDADQWVRLWDKRLQPAKQVAWSPDGRRIASGHFGGEVCVWNARNNQCAGFIHAHFNSVDALGWSPDGKQIATASGAIRIWDAETGVLSAGFGFYDGIVYKELHWFDPDTIATLETSYTENLPSAIRFWDVSTGEVKLMFLGWINTDTGQ
ncbi:MAG: hypothetical protein IT313_04495 [Anaerolineales bacterium]|nr:hypothetical protein [Anaerolineales bacterium]